MASELAVINWVFDNLPLYITNGYYQINTESLTGTQKD